MDHREPNVPVEYEGDSLFSDLTEQLAVSCVPSLTGTQGTLRTASRF